tara:strand:- start:1231 stop:1365 length:135 start_codon:yes stop_codon:yes gene_type:complete
MFVFIKKFFFIQEKGFFGPLLALECFFIFLFFISFFYFLIFLFF